MSAITTHVLDTARGKPAANILVVLERATADAPPHYQELGRGSTDADGRLRTLLSPDAHLAAGTYRITFHTAGYFRDQKFDAFYPEVSVLFAIVDPNEHFHVPLLLSPFGYSTYRGT